MLSRLRNAWRTLWGRDPDRSRYLSEIAKMRAQWLDLLLEIDNTLEKLTAADQRLKQRIRRAAKKAENEPQQPTQMPVLPANPKARARAKLRAIRAAQSGGAPGPAPDESEGGSE